MLGRTAAASLLLLLSFHSGVAGHPPSGPRRHVEAVRTAERPVIDGRLDDAVWSQAPAQTGFERAGLLTREILGEEVQTTFRVLYDDAHVYFGIECREPHMDQLTVLAAAQHDAAMWSDDDIELFIDPVGDRNEYYQLTVNSRGTQVDLYSIERGNTQKPYSALWQAETHHGEGFWSVEVALPFAALFQRPSESWSPTWAFNLARTRTPAPRYNSVFSPANGYHDPDNFGSLGPIEIDAARFNLLAEPPRLQLTPASSGFTASGTITVENRGATPFAGHALVTVLADPPAAVRMPVEVAPRSSTALDVGGLVLPEEARLPVLMEIASEDGLPVLASRFDQWLRYVPLTLQVTRPNYRNNLYPSQSIDTVLGVMRATLPVDRIRGLTARVELSGAAGAPAPWEVEIDSASLPFQLDVEHLPVGDYVLRGEIIQDIGKGKEAVIAAVEEPFRKLPRAAVEARIDGEGNLLIDGAPVFIRGWYGSMEYLRSAASFPEARMPHTTNFMMGASRDLTAETGLYTLRGVTRLIDESQAKLDQPIDDALKARLRRVVAEVADDPQIIGYYISDEPECRGLSPHYLQTLYEYLRDLDPDRFCIIVSRSPEQYMQACDVMAPHPYMNPQQYADGTRRFANHLEAFRTTMSKGAAANDGSKALWCMPQTFSYGGPLSRHPSFRESRWFAYTALASGAKGMVPFIFNGYWNHLENRLAMDAVFEELMLLAPAWKHPGTATGVDVKPGQIAALAKRYHPEGAARAHTFIVAANQGYDSIEGHFEVPALRAAGVRELLVLREDRTVAVRDGRFTDAFGSLGAHAYTTLQVLPHLSTLDQIQARIDSLLLRSRRGGNILARPDVAWRVMGRDSIFGGDSELVDGEVSTSGWLPWYGDRAKCQLEFEAPVTFSRLVLHTPTIRDADLEVLVDGKWERIHRWRDQLLQRLSWAGEPVTTAGVRIVPRAARQSYGGDPLYEITELELY